MNDPCIAGRMNQEENLIPGTFVPSGDNRCFNGHFIFLDRPVPSWNFHVLRSTSLCPLDRPL